MSGGEGSESGAAVGAGFSVGNMAGDGGFWHASCAELLETPVRRTLD